MTTDSGSVSVLGLGLMGSALARAFANAGSRVTVWNRSEARRAPFRDVASVADSVSQACSASDVIVVSLLDYEASNQLLRTPGVEAVVTGRTLIQLTTGTPAEARDTEAWAARHGLAYLDGAITTYPRGIGRDTTAILLSGARDVFEGQRALLEVIGKPTYCGEPIGMAATLDLAMLELAYAQCAGLLHAAALCEAESLPLEVFFTHASAPDWLLELATRHDFSDAREPIDAAVAAQSMGRPRRYAESADATLITHAAAVGLIARASRDADIDTQFPGALQEAYDRAVGTGHGLHDVPALYEALRTRSSS